MQEKNITSQKTKLCIGSMKHRVAIQKRTQQYLSSGMTYTFVTVWNRWANIETKSGLTQFSDINIETLPTHIFKIRKTEGITSEYWVNYDGKNYKILSVELVNDGDHHLLYCRMTGTDTKGGSKS